MEARKIRSYQGKKVRLTTYGGSVYYGWFYVGSDDYGFVCDLEVSGKIRFPISNVKEIREI